MFRSLLYFITSSVCLFTSISHAQQKLPVEISRVDFSDGVRPFSWNAIVIELDPKLNPDPQATNPRYVDDITVILTLGYEGPAANEFSFYQAEATIITLEVGQSKRMAFWLPYDVVERDDLPKEPKFWIVELEVGGNKLDLLSNNKSFSSNFSSRDMIENFMRQAKSGISDNEGILVPTYLSPNPYVETREPPAFIRKEQQ